MTAWALYSEIDPFAAAWLTKLIGAGHIMPGVVDTRSLEDLTPDECNEFRQVHLCAGIGVWSHALRMAGWEDDRPCWTASFPCQPFSAAGKGAAFADERHIWPSGHWLIDQCRPAKIFGEQVASKDGLAWLDVVSADLEGSGYAFGAADLCAAGVGAPHIRQRSYWVADADGGLADGPFGGRREECADSRGGGTGDRAQGIAARLGDGRDALRLDDDDDDAGLEGQRRGYQTEGGRDGAVRPASATGELGGMAQPCGVGRERRQTPAPGHEPYRAAPERPQSEHGCGVTVPSGFYQDGASPTDGFWRAADWLYCRDGKWRPVEPGTFPLVNGATNRVGRLRGYGNAIVAPLAKAFIESVMG